MNKYHVVLLTALFSVAALAQKADVKPAAPAPQATPQAAPVPPLPPQPPKPEVVTPAKSEDALELQLALEKEKSIGLEAQNLQQMIEPQMAPLRQSYGEQEAIVATKSDIVRKANGWGPDIQLDRNPKNATYGQWLKQPPKPEVVPPAPVQPPKK